MLVGVAFALGGVTYPWYPLLLVALVALDGRAEWLAVAAASYPGYFTAALGLPFGNTQRFSYGLALGAVPVVGLVRRRQQQRPRRRSGTAPVQPTGGGPSLPSANWTPIGRPDGAEGVGAVVPIGSDSTGTPSTVNREQIRIQSV